MVYFIKARLEFTGEMNKCVLLLLVQEERWEN